MKKNDYTCDDKDIKWITRILIAIIVILTLIIICILSLKLSNDTNIINVISIGAGLTSIMLAIVAIGISLKQEYSSTIINFQTKSALDSIDGKINKLDYMVSNIDMNEFANIVSKNYEKLTEFKTTLDKTIEDPDANIDVSVSSKLKELSKDIDDSKNEFINNSKEIVSTLLRNLTPRQEKILRMHYGLWDGKIYSFNEISNEMSISRSAVNLEFNRGINKLKLMNFPFEVIDDELRNYFKRIAEISKDC